MGYQIKYIGYKNIYLYNINGQIIKFRTKSMREVEQYLKESKYILENNMTFESIELINSDLFFAFEYFSIAEPQLVKNYFLNVYYQLKILLSERNKKPSKQMAIGHIANVPIDDTIVPSNKTLHRIIAIISVNLKSTTLILDEIFFIRDRTFPEVIQTFTTSFGELKYYKKKFKSPLSYWGLNNQTQTIFRSDYGTIEEQSETIINLLTEVHTNVINNNITELVDFLNPEEARIFLLYVKAYPILIKQYFESAIISLIEKGFHLKKCGDQGISLRDILILISKKKDKKRICINFANCNGKFLNNIISELINEYMAIQVDMMINNNQYDFNKDIWTYYYKLNGKLKYATYDFSSVNNDIVKKEFMQYMKELLEKEAQTKNTLRQHKRLGYRLMNYNSVRSCLVYFINNHNINKFADITPSMVDQFLKDLQGNSLNNTIPDSIQSIGRTISEIKFYSKWINKSTSDCIEKPNSNVFLKVEYRGAQLEERLQEETPVIDEYIINQILEKIHFLNPPIYRRLLLCLLNSPRRFNEFQHFYIKHIEPIAQDNVSVLDEHGNPVYRLTFIEHKKHRNKEININGLNYSKIQRKVVVNHIVAREIYEQIDETKTIEEEINKSRKNKIIIDKVFVIKDEANPNGYSLIDTTIFNDAIKSFIIKNNVKDKQEQFWNFNTKQTRTTGANLMVANGCDLDELQEQLGHDRSETTYKSYIKIANLQISQENTDFLKKEFDGVFNRSKSNFNEYEQVALFNKFCLDYNKIYYNRKLLGVCGLSLGENCPYEEKNLDMISPEDEMPCASCSNLYVGSSCKMGWMEIYNQCKNDVDTFETFFKENNLEKEDYDKIREYKKAYAKFIKSRMVVEAITK